MTLPEDTILENRYRIDRLLAHGGMGAIYRAFDTNLSTPVAIKENFFQTPARIAQFKQEALILARLRHPSLPRVIHHFSFEGQQYLVMDFIEGEDLWQIVKRRGQPLTEPEALNYLIQVCQAVSYLHRQSPPIIHRDIKPQNIKITPDGRAVLVDFGIAKQVTDEKTVTQAGARGATPGFSPPEQYSGQGTGPTSDVYALGATLYAVLTGQKPPNSISLMVGGKKFRPPNVINPKLSQQVNQAIIQAMQPQPHLRPQTVDEWQKQLEIIIKSMPEAQPEKNDTLTSKAKTGKGDTLASTHTGPVVASTGFWLVDSRGLGYPIGLEPLRIGRHSDADVVINDANVSRFHCQVKVEKGHCFALDENSANGTLLNGHQLLAGWHPFTPGDVLTVGPARFYLTTTQPVKLTPPKPPTSPSTHPKTATDELSKTPLPTKKRSWLVWVTLVAILIALVSIGIFFWLNPHSLPFTVPGIAQIPTAIPAPPTVQPSPTPTATATSQAAVLVSQPTATPTNTPGITPTKLVAAQADTIKPAATKLLTATFTPTPTATRTPTSTPGATRPAATRTSGPTPIPLKSTVTMAQLGAREVIDVDFNPKNPLEVYALVKRDGIYKSVNSGDGPWQRLDVDGASLTALVIDPTNPLRLYAPTWNAVLKSTDGGNTWDAKTGGLVSNQVVDTLAIHPANPDVMFAGIGETLVVSADQGVTWTSAGYGNGVGASRIYAIVIDPFKKDTLYVAGLAAAIYKSENSGRDFIPLPYNVGRGAYGLAAHPGQENVYLAGVNAFNAGIIKTENGFEFRSVSDGLIYGGADSAYSAIAFAPGNPSIVYAGSGYESEPDSKGIYKSTNGGESWQRINKGLAINPDTGFPHYVKSMVVHLTNPDIAFAATGSGLYKTIDGGENWVLK